MVEQNNEYSQVLSCHTILWHPFWDKHQISWNLRLALSNKMSSQTLSWFGLLWGCQMLENVCLGQSVDPRIKFRRHTGHEQPERFLKDLLGWVNKMFFVRWRGHDPCLDFLFRFYYCIEVSSHVILSLRQKRYREKYFTTKQILM